MWLTCRRRRFRAMIILVACILCLLYVIGSGLLEIKHDQLINEEQSLSERSKDVSVAPEDTKSTPKEKQSVLAEPDDTWIKTRQELLRNASSTSGVSKVVLYSYMRGGSTLFSHVFNVGPQPAILWYEALDAFHVHYSGLSFYSNPLRVLYHSNQTRRSMDNRKRLAMTQYLEDLLNCHTDLPLEALTHRFIAVSKALSGFWECTKSQPSSMPRLKHLIPATSCETIEFDDNESDLTIVRCPDVFRFLRGLHREKMMRGGRAMDLFQSYIDQVEDSELRKTIIGLCGDFWRFQLDASDVEFMDEEVENERTMAPFRSEERCRTIQSKFSQFLNAAWYMRVLSEQAMCRDVLRSSCSKANVVVAGVHRVAMSDLEPLIQRMPDVRIVYYVRDPRAIAVSRADPLTVQTYLRSDNWTAVNESGFLCRRMWDDLQAKKRLEGRYPGSILTVRYEDFVLDPRGTVAPMYEKLMRNIPEDFDRWVNETLNASTYDGVFGIHRVNSREHISKWRSKVSEEEASEMTRHCFRVLRHLGYRI